MDEKTIQRIKKLQALAERGVGGEKTTAQTIHAKRIADAEYTGKCMHAFWYKHGYFTK